jgi:hypothetical protein
VYLTDRLAAANVRLKQVCEIDERGDAGYVDLEA